MEWVAFTVLCIAVLLYMAWLIREGERADLELRQAKKDIEAMQQRDASDDEVRAMDDGEFERFLRQWMPDDKSK